MVSFSYQQNLFFLCNKTFSSEIRTWALFFISVSNNKDVKHMSGIFILMSKYLQNTLQIFLWEIKWYRWRL